MRTKIERLLFALMFAFAFAGTTFLIANADEGPPPPANNITYDNCVACHKDIQGTWQNGAHGNATSDSVFSQQWNAQGKPGACLV